MESYRELDVWQEARKLCNTVYDAVEQLPQEELYGLSSQMRRAVVSIASNIAEGAGRGSRRDYLHFVYIARGSAYELETQLIICGDRKLIDRETLKMIYLASISCDC